jgi:DNA-binding SARP family transcriptional activator
VIEVKFQILGHIVAYHDGQQLVIGRRKERALLGLLLLEINRLIPSERLADLLWNGSPPDNARRLVSAHASRLRSLLRQGAPGEVQLIGKTGGYVLCGDAVAVDAHRFRAAVDAAYATPSASTRTALLRNALSMWHGPAIAGCLPDEVRIRITAGLSELRTVAEEQLLQARLETGPPAAILPDLLDYVHRHPLREFGHGLLMFALHHSGRRAEALEHFQQLRRGYIDELGLEPGHELRHLHRLILHGESTPEGPPGMRGARLLDDQAATFGAEASRPTTTRLRDAWSPRRGLPRPAAAVDTVVHGPTW